MTLKEAEKRKEELSEELTEIKEFIEKEKAKDILEGLEVGKYYAYRKSFCTKTFFQFTETCRVDNTPAGPFIVLDKYLQVDSTRMYENYSMGNHMSLPISSEFSEISEMSEEQFNYVCKKAISYLENMKS